MKLVSVFILLITTNSWALTGTSDCPTIKGSNKCTLRYDTGYGWPAIYYDFEVTFDTTVVDGISSYSLLFSSPGIPYKNESVYRADGVTYTVLAPGRFGGGPGEVEQIHTTQCSGGNVVVRGAEVHTFENMKSFKVDIVHTLGLDTRGKPNLANVVTITRPSDRPIVQTEDLVCD